MRSRWGKGKKGGGGREREEATGRRGSDGGREGVHLSSSVFNYSKGINELFAKN